MDQNKWWAWDKKGKSNKKKKKKAKQTTTQLKIDAKDDIITMPKYLLKKNLVF